MLRWGYTQNFNGYEDFKVARSGREAIELADEDWNRMADSDKKKVEYMYVGLFNVDESGFFMEDEHGNYDVNCRTIIKNYIEEDTEPRFKQILKASDLSMKEFAKTYGIPYRSIQNWSLGEREAPDYVLDMLEKVVWETKENI